MPRRNYYTPAPERHPWRNPRPKASRAPKTAEAERVSALRLQKLERPESLHDFDGERSLVESVRRGGTLSVQIEEVRGEDK